MGRERRSVASADEEGMVIPVVTDAYGAESSWKPW
jgi:hypothetical protein